MVASTDIKFFVHTNNNAPQLQNAYGSMINVLDACLVNGINIGTVSSLTASGTTVTALFSSAHNLMQYQVIKIAGANQPEFNGEHRILTVPNAQSITFELAAAPSVTTATGTIEASLPSLGWEKPFSSSNPIGGGKAAYRSKNLLLPSRPFLRVVDELDPAYTATYTKYAKVGIVEDMTDIDTMLGVQAPYDNAAPNKNWVGTGSGTSAINGWAKWHYARSEGFESNSSDSSAATSGKRSWIVAGNGDYFYILPTAITSDIKSLCYGFGAFATLLNTDNSNNFLSATLDYSAANSNIYKSSATGLGGNSSNQKSLLQRAYNQSANSVQTNTYSLGVSSTLYSGGSDYVGNKLLTNVSPFAPVFFKDTVLRGEVPNFYWLLQDKPFNNYALLERNRELYIAVTAVTGISNTIGQVVLKVGGV